MASVLDYLYKADAQQAANKNADLDLQQKPVQSLIEAANASLNAGKLQQSQSRFNGPAYMFSKILGSMTPAARAAWQADPNNASMIANMVQEYGSSAVQQLLSPQGNAGQSNSQITQSGSISPSQNSASVQNSANAISAGAQNDYDKSTHTAQQVNRSIFGKNLETTLNQINQISDSVAKYGGLQGQIKKLTGPANAAGGNQNDPDYQNWNTFNKTLLPQAAGQLRQFYAGSIQPSEIDKKEKQLSPQIWETPSMYSARMKTFENNIAAELGQQQQTYSQNLHTGPATANVVTSQSTKPDFMDLLRQKGVQ